MYILQLTNYTSLHSTSSWKQVLSQEFLVNEQNSSQCLVSYFNPTTKSVAFTSAGKLPVVLARTVDAG